ncbi:hypothetical protein VTK73DRAFT_8526 [Phialemonium thermophilum]|uniref:TECPR1-like DysF domain-containing protein n=1 Tax=Phialemonium thermophilum TaxID=223376 RepID=A0ABR3W851_9PEZI
MDEYAIGGHLSLQDDSPPRHEVRDEEPQAESASEAPATPEPEPERSPRSRRHAFRKGFFKAAGMQDMLLERLLAQVIPRDRDGMPDPDAPDETIPSYAERPGFTVTTMSNNFRRFNARIGVVFKFQARVLRLLSWRRPTETLSLMAVYTFVCLDPYLLFALPFVAALVGVLIPSFVARHPAAPSPRLGGSSSGAAAVDTSPYSPRGPPLAPAPDVRPAKELSRDFFRNMRDLQNCMEDFSVLHDRVVALVVPRTNFSDEALSSALFSFLCAAAAAMTLAAHLLPWRPLFLVAGWVAVVSGHPAAPRLLRRALPPAYYPSSSSSSSSPDKNKSGTSSSFSPSSWLSAWAARDVILDSDPETREVEIFELQRRSPLDTGEWEPWLFSPSPYDPLSAPRLAGQRPTGARFFEDVRPPEGWEWSGKKWALDLWSREWVEERIITGVEVETEGERWVYDIHNEHEAGNHGGVVEGPYRAPAGPPAGLSWEEWEEGMGRRGEWRRRRWVRLVRRKKVASGG